MNKTESEEMIHHLIQLTNYEHFLSSLGSVEAISQM